MEASSVSLEPRVEPCPQCDALMANDPRFAFWCEACGWNLVPSDRVRRLGRIARWRSRFANRSAQSLAYEVIRRGPSRPRFTLSTAAALTISFGVYGGTLAAAVIGVILILSAGFVGIFVGLCCLGFAWVMRPRLPMASEPTLGRSELPRLFALLDRAAESLSAPPIDDVIINHEANASYERLGWRRRRVLTLGLPLFLSLDPGERVALLGHEIAHAINGDAGRLLLMSGGATALLEAYVVLDPDSILPAPAEGLVGYFVIPFRIVQLGFARAILALAYVQMALCYRTAQRAEYYADALSAHLAGSSPILTSFTRLYASRWAMSMNLGNSSSDPVGLAIEKIRSMPARELQRLRRVEELNGASLRATHPPIFYRERVVSGRPVEPGRFHLGTGESDAIDRELERFREPIGRKMVDAYLSSIS